MSVLESSKRRAAKLSARVIPFKIWCELNSPSDFDKKMYWKIVEGLKEIAKKGSQEEWRCQKIS